MKLEEAIEKVGVVVDSATHDDPKAIMADSEGEIAKYPEKSFQHIFWKQQQEAVKKNNVASM